MCVWCIFVKEKSLSLPFYSSPKVAKRGFSLIELLVVTAIIVFLSAIAAPNFMKMLAKAKRTEAYLYLRTLAHAQKAYYVQHGSYTTSLSALGWKPEGSFVYTYGFPGSEGETYVNGQSGASAGALSGAGVNKNGFVIRAAGAIYGEKLDIISVDQAQVFSIVSDALV